MSSMPIKSMLTVTGTSNSQRHVDHSIRIAKSLGAQLTVLVMDVSTPSVVSQYGTADAINRGDTYDHGVHAVEQRAKKIETQVQESGVEVDVRLVTAYVLPVEVDNVVSSHAQFADLTVLPLRLPVESTMFRHIYNGVVFHAQSPVLLVPEKDTEFPKSSHTVIGWDSGVQSAHAVRQSVAGLAQAKRITAVSIDATAESCCATTEGLIRYLNSHQVKVALRNFSSVSGSTGEALLDAAMELDADLLVMGAYGHSRLREYLIGGTTRDVIKHAQIPVLMVH